MKNKTKIISLIAATSMAGAGIAVTHFNNWEYRTIGSLQTNKLFNANVSRDKERIPFILEPGAVYDPVAETVTVQNVAKTKIGRYGISLSPEPLSLVDPVDTVTIDNFSGYWNINSAGALVFSVTADVIPGGTRGFNYEFMGPYPVDFVVDAAFSKVAQTFIVNEKNEMISGTTHQLNVTNNIADITGLSNIKFTSSDANILTVTPDGLITANPKLITEETATITISGDKTFLHQKPADYVITVKVGPEILSLRSDAPTIPGIYEDGAFLDSLAINETNVSLIANSTALEVAGDWDFKNGGKELASIINDTVTLVFTPHGEGIKPFEVDVKVNVMKTVTLNAKAVTKVYDNTALATKDMLDSSSIVGINAAHTGVAIDNINAKFTNVDAGTTTVTVSGVTLKGTASDKYRFAAGDITLPAEITKAPIRSSDLKPKIETKIKTGDSIKAIDILEDIKVLASGDTLDEVLSEIPTNDISMDLKKKIL